MLHNTTAEPLRTMLPSLAAERREIYEAYLRLHSDVAGAALRKRPFVAVFIPLEARRFLFEGLYEVAGSEMHPTREIYSDPAYRVISDTFGDAASDPETNIARRDQQEVFDLRRLNVMSDYRGRVVIRSPGGRAYVRVAATTPLEIVELTETHQLSAHPPDWREFIVSASFLRELPRSWADRLSQWRGIYLITDQSDGARYVGAAYGSLNLLGRWTAHVKGDHGVTRQLRDRASDNFRFSILERLSPDAEVDEVVALERSWMRRLDTVTNGLNS